MATKADLNELKIELKAEWKADIAPAIAPLATRAEVKAEAEETRRHFDVVAEGLRSNIAQLGDAIGTVSSTLERSIAENHSQHATFIAALDNQEVRLALLERANHSA